MGCVSVHETSNFHFSLVIQSLVQARKAGIASAMAARSSIKDEELVSEIVKRLQVFLVSFVCYSLQPY